MLGRDARGYRLRSRLARRLADPKHDDVAALLEETATLHNNIYYFPVGERAKLLAHVREFLAPGGRLLLTTACRGGSPTGAVS